MADADEDTIPRGPQMAEDNDPSDEIQDFTNFLTSISSKDQPVIPKRGEKDFEPHATALQSNTLAQSRQAMHNALAYDRVSQPGHNSTATYHPESNMAYVINPKGVLFAKMGKYLPPKDDPLSGDGEAPDPKRQRTWLLPEEVLYLLERGSLDVRWPSVDGEGGLLMSLQGAYAMFLGEEDRRGGELTFERFAVYANLKRAGYTVTRAASWDSSGPPLGEECFPPKAPVPIRTWQAGFAHNVASLWTLFSRSSPSGPTAEQQATGPLITPSLYRSYIPIYASLALIPYHDPTTATNPSASVPNTTPPFSLTYNVYKPSTPFRKSAPPAPDFRIAVISARDSPCLPTLTELSALMETIPYDPPKADARLYARLKHGYKNVVLAIVDQGVTSYIRVADAAFGRERIYESVGSARGGGGKRGGGRGGRGRGRGRGRG